MKNQIILVIKATRLLPLFFLIFLCAFLIQFEIFNEFGFSKLFYNLLEFNRQSLGLFVGLLFLFLLVKKIIFPESYIKCSVKGVYVSEKEWFYAWSDIKNIYSGELEINHQSNGVISYRPAVFIQLNELEFPGPWVNGQFARIVESDTYGFVYKKNHDLTEELSDFWLKYSGGKGLLAESLDDNRENNKRVKSKFMEMKEYKQTNSCTLSEAREKLK